MIIIIIIGIFLARYLNENGIKLIEKKSFKGMGKLQEL